MYCSDLGMGRSVRKSRDIRDQGHGGVVTIYLLEDGVLLLCVHRWMGRDTHQYFKEIERSLWSGMSMCKCYLCPHNEVST